MACNRVKGFLSRAGVEFQTRDIEEDGRAYDELLALGARTVPTTVIDGRVIAGFDEATLREALNARAAGSADR